eukprot:Skav213165  [mRNA]  locus=scaffold31:223169:226893:- [translate_table: standard]
MSDAEAEGAAAVAAAAGPAPDRPSALKDERKAAGSSTKQLQNEVCQDFKWGQSVQLSSTQAFDLTREFSFHDCIPNRNDKKGPVVADGTPIYPVKNRCKEESGFIKSSITVLQDMRARIVAASDAFRSGEMSKEEFEKFMDELG